MKESCQDKLGHDFFYCTSHSVFPRFSLNNNKSQKLNLEPIKINRWGDLTDFQYKFDCRKIHRSRKKEEY